MINKIKSIRANPITINIIFLLSIIVSVFNTYLVVLTAFGYHPIDVSTKIAILISLIIFLPTMVLGGSFVKFENKKQILQGLLPIFIILVLCMIISTFTNIFENEKYYLVTTPYNLYRGAFFQYVEEDRAFWKQMFIPHFLINIVVTCAFALVPYIKYVKSWTSGDNSSC